MRSSLKGRAISLVRPMPEDKALDAMAYKIAGCSFASLNPDNRARVMELAIAAEQSNTTIEISNLIEGVKGVLADIEANSRNR